MRGRGHIARIPEDLDEWANRALGFGVIADGTAIRLSIFREARFGPSSVRDPL